MRAFWKTNGILLTFGTLCCLVGKTSENECGPYMEHIVSGAKGVPDQNISASSMHSNDNKYRYDPKYGRLYLYFHINGQSASGWSAKTSDTTQYIQVAFGKPMIVCAVLTQGRAAIAQWIKSFNVLRSLDGVTWDNVKNTENNLNYPGSTDQTTVVRNNFKECVEANYMRINPKTWHEHISLRMDFLGCSKMRKEFLKFQTTGAKIWKRSPVYIENTDYLSEQWAPHLGSCAISCYLMSRCMDFKFNSEDQNCVLLAGGISQNTHNAAVQSHIYSRRIDYPTLNNDYEIKANGTHRTYYKIITEKKTKTEASQICAKDGSRLLVIDNSQIMATLQEDINKSLILAQETEYFVNGENNEGTWIYDTKVVVPANLWASSLSLIANGNCIIFTATGLKTKDCLSQLYFVCEMLI